MSEVTYQVSYNNPKEGGISKMERKSTEVEAIKDIIECVKDAERRINLCIFTDGINADRSYSFKRNGWGNRTHPKSCFRANIGNHSWEERNHLSELYEELKPK